MSRVGHHGDRQRLRRREHAHHDAGGRRGARSTCGSDDDFIAGLHSLGDLSPDRRLILHFPEEKLIWSVGSGYGGNALLGKKCHALRLASSQAREEGWLAEHMLIIGVEDPEGRITYLAGRHAERVRQDQPRHGGLAAAGLARVDGGRRHRLDPRGQDTASSAPSIPSAASSAWRRTPAPRPIPNATAMVRSNTIFTNVALTPEREPWWEGLDAPGAARARSTGRAARGQPGGGPAAHPNSRFTVPAQQCPSIAPNWEDPQGVPISGFIFGSRRAR